MDFAKHVFSILEKTDSDIPHLRITEQTEAAASSVAANIAEGKGRYSRKEFKQYLCISRGSLY